MPLPIAVTEAPDRPSVDAMLEYHDFFFTRRVFESSVADRAARYEQTRAWLTSLIAPWTLQSNLGLDGWLTSERSVLLLDGLGRGWSDQFLSEALRGLHTGVLTRQDVYDLACQDDPDDLLSWLIALALGTTPDAP